MDAVRLMKELRANYDQEVDYLPKETGLDLIESAAEVRFAAEPAASDSHRTDYRTRFVSRAASGSRPGAEMPKWRICGV